MTPETEPTVEVATSVGARTTGITYQRNGWAVTEWLWWCSGPSLTERQEGRYTVTNLATGYAATHGGIGHDEALNFCRRLGDLVPNAFRGVAFGDRKAIVRHADFAGVKPLIEEFVMARQSANEKETAANG